MSEGTTNVKIPVISISSSPLEVKSSNDNRNNKRQRKQEHPTRSLKQLASVADKILDGIIVIEPLLPWEQHNNSIELLRHQNHIRNRDRDRKGKGNMSSSKRISLDDDASDESSIGSPKNSSLILRPTVTRSPAPMGILLESDTIEPGISERRLLYESIINKRRNGPSRAGMPLDITSAPGSSLLDPGEFEVCSTLRLYPLQYFQSRDTLVRNYHSRGFYKKSAAQKMLHIDVNKTGKLYDYFVSRNWMPPSSNVIDAITVTWPPETNWHLIIPSI